PLTFTSIILFYAILDANAIVQHLKLSIAETLNIYYPFSGWTRPANVIIDRFDEDFPFTHARVDCRIAHFLKRRETELLNRLLPRQPFQRKPKNTASPVLEFHASILSCGGVALGWACSHQLVDAAMMRSFLKTICVVSRGDPDGVVRLDFAVKARLFLPREPSPENNLNLMETL
ncbi:unnamed protein product, partial [Linum tenue]